jgi:tetratricopeptide (TPR) repeat protein
MKKIAFEQKMLLDLLESVNEKLKEEPGNVELSKMRGLVFSLLDRYEDAINEFVTILNILPNDISTYFLKSDCHLNLNEMAQAKREFFRATFLQREENYPEDQAEISDIMDDQERKDIETVLEYEKNLVILKYFSAVEDINLGS